MENEQDPQSSVTLDFRHRPEDDLTYPYAILHALLGIVLLAVHGIDASEAARYSGIGFIGLSILSLLRPIQLWKRRRIRRNMRRLARRQAREAKKAQQKDTATTAENPVLPVPVTLSDAVTKGQEPAIIRTSILPKKPEESPVLVR